MDREHDPLHVGRYLALMEDRETSWEYVTRSNAKGVVAVLAYVSDQEILLVDQFRPALGKHVLELPAGLAGDEPYRDDEPLLAAAKRELCEETGYEAREWWSLLDGPTSSGLTDEYITFFLATGLRQVREAEHHGVSGEKIRLHRVRVGDCFGFFEECRERGMSVDFKIHAALYAVQAHPMRP